EARSRRGDGVAGSQDRRERSQAPALITGLRKYHCEYLPFALPHRPVMSAKSRGTRFRVGMTRSKRTSRVTATRSLEQWLSDISWISRKNRRALPTNYMQSRVHRLAF